MCLSAHKHNEPNGEEPQPHQKCFAVFTRKDNISVFT